MITKRSKTNYPPAKKTSISALRELSAFARANQGRTLLAEEIPSYIREAVDSYRALIQETGFRLLSSDSFPNQLVQGQFLFWPLGQALPAMLPPPARPYKSVVNGRPIGIDLFAGAGGLSMGFEQAGVDIAACVEIDPIHCATHEYNFPYASSICGSVTDLTGEAIRCRSGIGDRDIEAVFGGAPCQGFSMIGKRAL